MRLKNIKKSGISLIVLIITIVLLIILATAIIINTSSTKVISNSKRSVFLSDIAAYEEELNLYKMESMIKGNYEYDLNVNKYTEPNIKDVIKSINSKYLDVLEIQNGELVYVGTDKFEYKVAFENNLLPEDELVKDDVLEELKIFITEWTVNAGDTITLPISGTCDFTVDYGDGTKKYKVTDKDDIDATHTYEEAGTYRVEIDGILERIDTRNYGISSREKLTKIVQWGDTKIKQIRFWGCTNLVGPIPEPVENSFIELTDVQHMFYGSNNLQCEIPEKLFYNCPKITSFNMAFSNCGFIGAIPEKLFAKCPNVTSFNSVFRQNIYITGPIPENLFANNPLVTDFSWAFQASKNIEGNLSENLFKNNTNATNFEYCFTNCNKLTGKAPKLWERNNIINYKACFLGCSKLSNYSEIPKEWKDI